MNSKDFLKEGFIEDASDVHMDHEVQMAREECYHAAEHALAIHKLLRNISEQQGLEGWVSSKITLANDYLNTVREHLEYELLQPQIDDVAMGMPIAENEQQGVAETSDYFRRRDREESIISGKKPARKKQSAQTSDYAKRREQEKKQGVAEAFGPLPRDSQQIRLGRHKVDIERVGLDKNYISFAWNDSQGQEHYEEVPVGDLGSYDDLIDRIKDEISYQERQYTDQGVAEGKKPDRYHIVGKDGKPANLASYADRASAIKDRDEKYPGAVVQQVGPRGKVKGVSEGQITEASKDFAERYYAGKEMEEILDNLRSSESPNVTLEIIKRIENLVAITGRGQTISGFGSAGELLDKLTDMYRQSQIRSGQMPQFAGRAPTARDMARQIANQTRGTYRYFKPESWTHRSGQRYRDPEDYVVYPDQESYDDALEWIASKGKKVSYQDHFGLNTVTQIGRYIVEPSSFTQGAFSDEARTTHRISVRLAKTMDQGGRQQVDITDQQAGALNAALRDIEATRSANAMTSVQNIIAVLRGMSDVKRVIANSKKILPRDKAKLDAIIAAAGKFQEPGNQGVAEGLNEMDKSAPQPGRDGKVSHSTYGSRDKKGSDYFKGKEAPGKPITKKQMEKDTLDILKKQGVAEGAKCNHTMEGENCPVHGLKECPGMKARALAEWRKQQRALKHNQSVMEFYPLGAALAAGAGLATGAGLSLLKKQDPKEPSMQQRIKDNKRKEAEQRFRDKMDQEQNKVSPSDSKTFTQDLDFINVPESKSKLKSRKIREQGITDQEIRQRIQPTFQATDAQLNDPEWMRSRGLIPIQDIERDYKDTLEKENYTDAVARAASQGLPVFQHKGKTYATKNPDYNKYYTDKDPGHSKGGQPLALNKQQTQQLAGTNIQTSSGAPVIAGSKMMKETTAGSVAGVVNPKSNKPKNQIGSLFGGSYKQSRKKQ